MVAAQGSLLQALICGVKGGVDGDFSACGFASNDGVVLFQAEISLQGSNGNAIRDLCHGVALRLGEDGRKTLGFGWFKQLFMPFGNTFCGSSAKKS
ncbi:hypothetical protein [Saccharophagus sp. K07]|uniref:hypothetical protein n=1 Tax=Saccharophagus sp. K07 TaxID=2283636 RepID=UPI0016522F22|nr:hypothetical protein [Saccharophagus sp. K07]